MKKQFIIITLITFFFIIFSTVSKAEVPAGDYDSAQGLCHDSLAQALRTIISNGYVFHTYGAARAEMYGYIDNNSGWVMCVYTGESFNLGVGGWPDDYELNCEHTYCQSWFKYDTGDMKTDLHHLFPTQPNVNSSRSNRPLDNVTVVISTWGSGDYISYNGKNSSSKNVFEPADQHKGDAARAILYFIVRYGRDLQQDIFNATTVNIDILPTLRQWHQQDPISQKEINRNDDIYDYQNNRNPFVDHPEYVEYIWGSCQSETDPPEFNGIKTAVPTGNTGE
ncbi:endonuclease [Candidatus Dependentiae bacterium]|nr:endonuclease [Candidatus Dependentiae bacterium]